MCRPRFAICREEVNASISRNRGMAYAQLSVTDSMLSREGALDMYPHTEKVISPSTLNHIVASSPSLRQKERHIPSEMI